MEINYTEKAKTKPSPRRRLILWFLSLFVLSACGCISTVMMGAAYFTYGELRTSISDELLPTAQYLYEHPNPMPIYLRVSNTSSGRVCYEAAPSNDYTFFYTDVFVNGMRVHKGAHLWNLSSDAPNPYKQPDEFNELCLYTGSERGNLKPGLHLIGVQLKKSPWDNRYPIYEWAVKVP